MSKERDDLEDSLSRLPTEELLRIVTADAAQYRQEAVPLAHAELRRRGIEEASPDLHRSLRAEREREEAKVQPRKLSRWLAWIHPSVDTVYAARKAARQAVVAAVLSAAATLLFAAMGANAYSLIDAALLVAVAVGVHRMSRGFAVLGLAEYILGRIVFWVGSVDQPGGLEAFFIIAFVNGVRGTFAFHRITSQSAPGGLDDQAMMRPVLTDAPMGKAAPLRLVFALIAAPLMGWWALTWRFLSEWPTNLGEPSVFKLFVYARERGSSPELVRLLAVGFVLGVVAAGTKLRIRSIAVPAPIILGLAAVPSFPLLTLVDMFTGASGRIHQLPHLEFVVHAFYAALVALAATLPHVLVVVVNRLRHAK